MFRQAEALTKAKPTNSVSPVPTRTYHQKTLSVPNEFSFHECLKFLARSEKEKMHVIKAERVRKLVKFDDGPVLFELSHPTKTAIQICFLNQPVSRAAIAAVSEYVNDWFDLETDLAPFYQLTETDQLLKNLTTRYYGLRLIKIPDLFEALCWAILGQQINVAFAYTLKQRFVENFGESFTFDGEIYWLFPTPEVVAELQLADLLRLQFNRQKAEYIIGLARVMRNGEVSKQDLLELNSIVAAREALMKIRGVGPWTASYVLMRCLGFRSAFPIEDIGLHNALQRQLNWTRKPTIAEIKSLSAGWNGWQAYATFYLYRSLL